MQVQTGKRTARKIRTQELILQVARRLFHEKGFGATRMEEIAAETGIAVGTLYNYVTHKGDLLLALVVESDRHCIGLGEGVLANLPADPVEALVRVALHDSRHSLDALDNEGWRHVLATVHAAPDSTFARAYEETTAQLLGLMTRAVAILQAGGSLRRDQPPEAIADILFSAKYMRFIEHVTSDGETFDDHAADVRRTIRTIVEGLLPSQGQANPPLRPTGDIDQ
jgi:AcrR family transcriptional regulator